jgi:hypothetical protein
LPREQSAASQAAEKKVEDEKKYEQRKQKVCRVLPPSAALAPSFLSRRSCAS